VTNQVYPKIIVVIIIFFMLTAVVLSLTNKSRIVWVNQLMPITKVDTDDKIVAIACNVYEGNEQITSMLKTLAKHNIQISFFIGGIWASKNTETLLNINKYDHDIQNHGYLHKRPTTLNEQKNLKEIKDTETIISNITGKKTTLFEPPYGDYDENTLTLLNSINYKLVTWSIDTIDWRNDATKDIIINRIKKKLLPGGIILIHPKSVTAESLEDIIVYIKSEGYKITSVKNLINSQ
jgi:peptidoglycan-N-acetylglucosamine deacetylase